MEHRKYELLDNGGFQPHFESSQPNDYAEKLNTLQYSPQKNRSHDLEPLVDLKINNSIKQAMTIIL